MRQLQSLSLLKVINLQWTVYCRYFPAKVDFEIFRCVSGLAMVPKCLGTEMSVTKSAVNVYSSFMSQFVYFDLLE